MTPLGSSDGADIGTDEKLLDGDIFDKFADIFVAQCAKAGIDPAQARITWDRIKSEADKKGVDGEGELNDSLHTLFAGVAPERQTDVDEISELARNAWFVTVHNTLFSNGGIPTAFNAEPSSDLSDDEVELGIMPPSPRGTGDTTIDPAGDSGRISL